MYVLVLMLYYFLVSYFEVFSSTNLFSILWFSQVKSHKDIVHFETAYVVKLHSIAKLALSKSVGLQLY